MRKTRLSAALIALFVTTPLAAQTLTITRDLVFDSRTYFNNLGTGNSVFSFAEEDYVFSDTAPLIVPAGTYDRVELVLNAGPGLRFEIDPTPAEPSFLFNVLWRAGVASALDPNQAVDVAFINGTPGLPDTGVGAVSVSSNGTIFQTAGPSGVTLPIGGSSFESILIAQDVSPASYTTDTELTLDMGDFSFIYIADGDLGPDPGPFTRIVAIPEPSSLALLGLALALPAWRRRHRP